MNKEVFEEFKKVNMEIGNAYEYLRELRARKFELEQQINHEMDAAGAKVVVHDGMEYHQSIKRNVEYNGEKMINEVLPMLHESLRAKIEAKMKKTTYTFYHQHMVEVEKLGQEYRDALNSARVVTEEKSIKVKEVK